jgi:hypothetical protein
LKVRLQELEKTATATELQPEKTGISVAVAENGCLPATGHSRLQLVATDLEEVLHSK